MSIKNFIEEIEKQLPDLCTSQDLVELKLFSSPFEAMVRRKRGQPPEFLYLSKRRIVYPKSVVIEWLLRQAEQGSPYGNNKIQ